MPQKINGGEEKKTFLVGRLLGARTDTARQRGVNALARDWECHSPKEGPEEPPGGLDQGLGKGGGESPPPCAQRTALVPRSIATMETSRGGERKDYSKQDLIKGRKGGSFRMTTNPGLRPAAQSLRKEIESQAVGGEKLEGGLLSKKLSLAWTRVVLPEPLGVPEGVSPLGWEGSVIGERPGGGWPDC